MIINWKDIIILCIVKYNICWIIKLNITYPNDKIINIKT